MGPSGCFHLIARGVERLRVRALSGMVAGVAMFAFQEGIAPSDLLRRYNECIYVFATREEPHGQRPRVRSPEPRQRRHHVHRRPVSAAQPARVSGQHLYRLLLGAAARRVRQAPRGRRRARSDADRRRPPPRAPSRSSSSSPTTTSPASPSPASRTPPSSVWSTTIASVTSPPPPRCTSWRCLGALPAPSWPSSSRSWASSLRTPRPSCCSPL